MSCTAAQSSMVRLALVWLVVQATALPDLPTLPLLKLEAALSRGEWSVLQPLLNQASHIRIPASKLIARERAIKFLFNRYLSCNKLMLVCDGVCRAG